MAEVRPCSTPGCGKIASTLQCPQCQSDRNQPSRYFCSQDCFRKIWKEHKIACHTPPPPPPHVEPDYTGPPGTYDPFSFANRPHYAARNQVNLRRDDSNFQYTGRLRAVYPIVPVPQRPVPEDIELPDYAMDIVNGESESEKAVEAHRMGKICKPHEIDGIRVVCRLAREVLDLAASYIRPGITTLELDNIVHDACIERKSYPSPLNYYRFPRSLCTSVNEVICHGIPDARPLEEGDIINLDVTLYHNGFHGDLNATYPVGKISLSAQHLIASTRRCLDRAIALCRPGSLFREVGKCIEPEARKAGLTVNKRYCGHGIGKLFHPAPQIPHYAENKAIGEMKVGQIFTIEPMINEGRDRDDHWPDNWTAVNRDGKLSAQFEETLLITKDGVEVLTAQPGWELPEEFQSLARGVVKNGNA